MIRGINRNNPRMVVFDLNVRITEGPVAGALIHCRSGKILETYLEPMVAVYKIPEGLDVDLSEPKIEIVGFRSK